MNLVKKDNSTKCDFNREQPQIQSVHRNLTRPQYLNQYKEFFKGINSIGNCQIIARLINNQIYTLNKQSNHFRIIDYHSTINHQIITLNVEINSFQLEIIILNQEKHIDSGMYTKNNIKKIIIQNQSPMHQQEKINFGSFSHIYQFSLNKQNYICKCIKYSRMIDNMASYQLLQRKKGQVFIQVLKQYCLLKILSTLQAAPAVNNILGFDLICYNDCIQFFMEKCLKDIKLNYQIFQQQLKQGLKLMHSLKLIHRDIKIENILYSPTYNKHVFCDFGVSRCVKQQIGQKSLSGYVGTQGYMSQQMKNIKKKGKYQSQFIDLYYNDIIGLKETLKDAKNKKAFIIKNLQNYYYKQNIKIIIIKFKYLIFKQQINNIYVLKSLFLPIKNLFLNFILELAPNQTLRKFYLDYYKYDLNQFNNQISQLIDVIYGKKIIKTFKVPINQQKQLGTKKLIQRIQSFKLKYLLTQSSKVYLDKNQIQNLTQLQQKISFNQYYYYYIIYLGSNKNTIRQKLIVCDSLLQNYKEYLIQTQNIIPQQQNLNKIRTSLSQFNNYLCQINQVQTKKILLRNFIEIILYYFPVMVIDTQFIRLIQITNNQLEQLEIIYEIQTLTESMRLNICLQQFVHQKCNSKSQQVTIIAKIILDIIYFHRSKMQFKEIEILPLKHLDQIINKLNNLKSYYKKLNYKLQKIIFLTYYNQMFCYFNAGYYNKGFQIFEQLTSNPIYLKWKYILLERAYYTIALFYSKIGDFKKMKSLKSEFQQREQDFKMTQMRFKTIYGKITENQLPNLQQNINEPFTKSIQFFQLIYSQKFKQLNLDIKYFLFKQLAKISKKFNSLKQPNMNYYQIIISYLQQQSEKLTSQLQMHFQSKIYQKVKIKLYQTIQVILTYYLKMVKKILSQQIIVKSIFEKSKEIIIKKIQSYINILEKFFGKQIQLAISCKYILFIRLNHFQQALVYITQKITNCKITNTYLKTLYLFCSNITQQIFFSRCKLQISKQKYMVQYYQIMMILDYPVFPQSPKFSQQVAQIYQRSNNFEYFLKTAQWLALMSYKYSSQRIYQNYSQFVKAFLSVSNQQFLLNKIDLIINSQFYKIQSKLKQLSLFVVYFLSRIYKRINISIVNKLINRVSLTLNVVCFRTKQISLNCIYRIKSYFIENKRKKKILKIFEMKNSLQNIKDKKINYELVISNNQILKSKLKDKVKKYNKIKITY